MSWSVAGGTGGVTARYDDLLAAERLLMRAAAVLTETGAHVAALGLHAGGDAFEGALLLCPGEVAAVAEVAAEATVLPTGAIPLGAEIEVFAGILAEAVRAYRAVDEALAKAADLALNATAFAATSALPGDVAVAALLYLDRDGLPQQLYDNPWMMDLLTEAAPGAVQGLGFGLATGDGLFPEGAAVLHALTGGSWPTSDYAQSLEGLIRLAGHGGYLQDRGTYTPHPRPMQVDWAPSSATFLGDLGQNEEQYAYGPPPRVVVFTLHHAHGADSYIVQIPGTDPSSGLTHGKSPYDWTADVNEMGSQRSALEDAVLEAMRNSSIPPGAPVMLSGHSLGGIVAANIAADPRAQRYRITSVVTEGSPIAHFHIPRSVSVLSIEHRQDPVPKLDGRDNPDQPNWTTITADSPSGHSPLDAHAATKYNSTMADLDEGDTVPAQVKDAANAWKRQNEEFMNGTVTATGYDLSYTP